MFRSGHIPILTILIAVLSPQIFKGVSKAFLKIPLKTKEKLRKAVSSYTTVFPIFCAVILYLLGYMIMGREFSVMLAPVFLPIDFLVLPICFSCLLGSTMEHVTIVGEKGLLSRKVFHPYLLYTYEEIASYAKILKPYGHGDCVHIYIGTYELVLGVSASFGGRDFLQVLSEKLDFDYNDMLMQMDGKNPQSQKMRDLSKELVKAEKKRLREKNMDKNNKILVDYICGKAKLMSFLLWFMFVLIIISIAAIIAMCIIDPKLLLFEGDYVVLGILALFLIFGVCSVIYFKFIVSMKEYREELKIKYNGLSAEQKQEVLACAKIYRESYQSCSCCIAFDTFYISDNFICGNLARCKTPKSFNLSPVVFEYISLKDVEAAKTDTYIGQTVLVIFTKDKKIYRCRADEKRIKELDERIRS